jgi:hypothetical protein
MKPFMLKSFRENDYGSEGLVKKWPLIREVNFVLTY